MAPLGRRDLLKLAAATAAGAALPAARAAAQVPVCERQAFRVAGLDPAHEGLRIAQLSDLHCGAPTPPERVRQAIAAANAFQPDLVVLTGDYVCRARADVGLAGEQLAGLTAPTVAVLGNHDHAVDAAGVEATLARLGYDVLLNQHTTLALRGAPFTVVGVDDAHTGHARPAEALAGAPAGSRLVLAHAPRTADALRARGEPLLCLSGHTHGGQIHVPVLTPLFMGRAAGEPYIRGRYRLGPVELYVNRGVGNAAVGLRLGSPPEVTLAVLTAAAG